MKTIPTRQMIFRLYPAMPLALGFSYPSQSNPLHSIHCRRLELVECLDGLAGTGQDTEDVEADLKRSELVSFANVFFLVLLLGSSRIVARCRVA